MILPGSRWSSATDPVLGESGPRCPRRRLRFQSTPSAFAVDRECPSVDAECLMAGVDTETVGADCAPIGGEAKTIDGEVPNPGGRG